MGICIFGFYWVCNGVVGLNGVWEEFFGFFSCFLFGFGMGILRGFFWRFFRVNLDEVFGGGCVGIVEVVLDFGYMVFYLRGDGRVFVLDRWF